VERGLWGEVRYAVRQNGAREAKEWIESASDSETSKFDHPFRKISTFGRLGNIEQFRKLDDDIWEFKGGANRILCFQKDSCWFLTHHYRKSGPKCPKKQIERAAKIRAEHLSTH
jgi:hypothetical protein